MNQEMTAKVLEAIRADQQRLVSGDGIPASTRLAVYNALEDVLFSARALYGAARNAQEAMEIVMSRLDSVQLDGINSLGELQGLANNVDRLCVQLHEKKTHARTMAKLLLNMELSV